MHLYNAWLFEDGIIVILALMHTDITLITIMSTDGLARDATSASCTPNCSTKIAILGDAICECILLFTSSGALHLLT